MGVTAKELAKKLNLSPAAVSLALNKQPGVSRQTRDLVINTAKEMGYDFSRIAEKQSATGHIYFTIYKRHGAVVSDTPFFSEMSEGIASGCRKAGYKLKISYLYKDNETMDRQLEDMISSDCIGMILLGTEMNRDDFKPFRHLPIPIVLLDTYFIQAPCSCVLINNIQGAYTACDYLIKKSRRPPGYLQSSYPIGNFAERAEGFYRAVKDNGLSSKKCIVHALTPSIDGAYADMMDILAQKEELASHYFADNDLIAIGAMRALKSKGYRIPKDISVIGFDDIPAGNIIEPPLTTIHVPKHHLGEMAARQLIFSLRNPDSGPVKTELNTYLVKRQSC